MRAIQWRRALAAFTCLSAIGIGNAWAVAPIPAQPATCRRLAASLREWLESVTEAVIEGQAATAPAAAERVAAWWRVNRGALAADRAADSLMSATVAAARARRFTEAAGKAVELSVASLVWCGGSNSARTTTDQLMLVDLAGMTAWLRARGVALDWPPAVELTAESLALHLVARGHAAVAARLRTAVTAALATPQAPDGDVTTAVRLLEIVDEAEVGVR